jgi:NAD(P)-dependent dehydrogenase (short-subunit alcohol dehydrogenase family)
MSEENGLNSDDQRSNLDLTGQVILVTGGAGVLCAPVCRFLASSGACLAILDINAESTKTLADEIHQARGEAIAVPVDITHKESLESALSMIMKTYGHIDVLINGAGGNHPQATTNTNQTFFDLPQEAMQWVLDLNLLGTILSCQVFGQTIAHQRTGSIINIASINIFRPLTRIPAYAAAKAAVSNFTQWLAVYMAQEFSTEIRANAIAPGFFLTNQNRYLLIDQDTGKLSKRGQAIIDHTPLKRFGEPDDLLSTVAWLLSPRSSFITGIVIPIDGGFSAYSGI